MKHLIVVFTILVSLPIASLAKLGNVDRKKTDLIVLHAYGGYECVQDKWKHFPSLKKLSDAVAYLSSDKAPGGAHFIISKDGEIGESTPIDKVAYHVFGKAFGTKVRYNNRSIGIELLNDGDGKDEYTKAQLDALVDLLKNLVKKYSISKDEIKAHSELDKRMVKCEGTTHSRRIDPGSKFPFEEVVGRVFQ